MEAATGEDAAAIFDLREAAAAWMKARSILQWEPGEVPLEEIAAQIAEGEWWVQRRGGQVVGALRLLREDPSVWPDASSDALYVHGLVIALAERGADLGAALLEWVEERCREFGVALLRLDCVETNHRLRRYYAQRGFREVGRVDFADPGWYPTTLLEKRLPAVP